MKKFFADGLIQIAIVLSLFRTELNLNNLNNYVSNYPEINEIILGSSSAYTQTQHRQNWLNDGTNGYAHHKSIDNYYANSIFSELHSLSRYRRVGQRDNDIDAWLVVGQSVPSESVAGNAEPVIQIPPQSSSTHHGPVQPVPEEASGPLSNNNVPELGLTLEKPGSELTKEDMDLIEVLWRQDMDLGVGREVYDQNMRREMEKEREMEMLKEKELKELQSKEMEEEPEQLERNANFIIDGETGEVIPMPVNDPPPTTQAPQQTPSETRVCDEQQQFLQQQEYLQPQRDYVQQPQQLQRQQQQQPQYVPPTPVCEAPQQSAEGASSNLQDEIEAIIASATQQFTQEQEQVDRNNNRRLEQQWAEVAELLNQEQQLGVDSAGALLQNATLSAAINSTPEGFNQTIAELSGSAPSSFAMMGPTTMTNETFEPFPAVGANNESMHDPAYGSLFNLDTQGLMFSNMSGSGHTLSNGDGNSTLNHTENLLQELMDTDLSHVRFNAPAHTTDLMNALQSQLSSGNVSSDSAVSSMSSPSDLQDMNETGSVFSNQTSMYDSLQGATGGSDYDSSGEPSKLSKNAHYKQEYSHDFGYRMSDSLNHSSAFNDSDHHYTPADINQVKHNHTYPMQSALQPPPQMQQQEQQQQRRPSRAPGSSKSKCRSSRSGSTKRVLTPDYDPRIASARDARKAHQLKVPFSLNHIIHSSVDEFNEMLAKHDLTEPQLQLIRDIRRRGKNKVAAQNCRKRKLDVILTLEQEVMRMRQKKEDLLRERQSVSRERTELKHKLDTMYTEVLTSLRDEDGQPYDPSRYSLQHAEDGSVIVVPRNTTCAQGNHKQKSSKKKKGSKKN